MTPAATSAETLPLADLEVVDDAPRLVVIPGEGGQQAFDFDLALHEASARMRRYALRRLYHDADADEVVQEAMLRALQHRTRFASADDLMAWLTVVTGHLVIDRVRARSKATPVAELPSTARVGRDTADIVVARHEARVALDALEAMPSRQAAVLWAREVEGLDYTAIGARFALSEPSVRSLLHRARKTLRREYAARGGTLPVGELVALAPWLDPLKALGRLRDSARRFAGPAASVAVLTVAGLVPAVSPEPQVPAPAPAVRLPLTAAMAPTAAPSATRPAGSTPSATDTGVAAAAAAPPAVTLPVKLRSVHGCTDVNDTAVGVNCLAPQPQTRLYIGPELPANPTSLRHIAVEHRQLDCTAVPDLPLTECAADSGPASGNPLPLVSTSGDSP